MHRKVIGWAICGRRHCRRPKIFYLPQSGIKPRSLDLHQTLYHIAVKADFYRKAVKASYIITRSCDKLFFILKKEQIYMQGNSDTQLAWIH